VSKLAPQQFRQLTVLFNAAIDTQKAVTTINHQSPKNSFFYNSAP